MQNGQSHLNNLIAASLSSSVKFSSAIVLSDGCAEITVDLGARGAFGSLSESRIQTKFLKPWGLLIQVRPSLVCSNRWVRLTLAWAGLIIPSVDINDVKIEEVASKLSMSFLFISFLEITEHLGYSIHYQRASEFL
ncbi:hypothetical protein VF14_00505 [Nostoc linckia z18]|uniref:Uncharacterized protein n=2 Tax=Nostoc linckia TaxID=92942 RepID=A0A9Q5ZAV5_NOSLI|nr:hypothetical protein VF02_06165 [Nostoc linckia z1]PHJ71140.1 hypothetical protein VF05_08520 [Nostoc linckia z3]PHJ76579.1 hypothetical protein VF03_07375 [Nostoc linckia z2]PHJ84611.1 hypothetical protein VF06_09410 [Nostoc linckia z4]PHJ91775.1 hypothetical protein VF07_04410 [Nostoc linckia z6]PHJ96357.1 hypothetical protein VF04_16010 [Nostoc linckia z7]PHK02452.1 hypothetical protein VF08_18655 [Nostoc linckia z8]PHK13272.1 hypothetical protein VF09_00800 [Nostoc linckia z9]PHK2345